MYVCFLCALQHLKTVFCQHCVKCFHWTCIVSVFRKASDWFGQHITHYSVDIWFKFKILIISDYNHFDNYVSYHLLWSNCSALFSKYWYCLFNNKSNFYKNKCCPKYSYIIKLINFRSLFLGSFTTLFYSRAPGFQLKLWGWIRKPIALGIIYPTSHWWGSIRPKQVLVRKVLYVTYWTP